MSNNTISQDTLSSGEHAGAPTQPLQGVGISTASNEISVSGTHQLHGRAMMMKDLNERIPNNDYGLPEYIYRADLLPDPTALVEMNGAERNEHLQNAVLDLDYTQGFPTLAAGEPFWAQFPHESEDAYRAFLAYVDMPRSAGQRLGADQSVGVPQVPVRQLHLLQSLVGKKSDELSVLYYMYYWAQRVRAYDLFTAAIHSKRKEQRLYELEDNHYAIAAKYIDYTTQFLDQVFAAPDEHALKPKEALDLLTKMIQVQRLSVGVSPTGANMSKNDPNALPANANLEVILRTIAQQAGIETQKDTNIDTTKLLLEDADTLAQAQELIIRMGELGSNRVKNTNVEALDG